MQAVRKVAVGVAMALVMGSAMARNTEIYEPPQIMWATGVASTQQQLRDRIVAASQSLGWAVAKEEAGRLELHYNKQGKHQVTIAVQYDEAGYQIAYLNSVNLDYEDANGVRRIHPNYNRWIRNLVKQIGTA
jgi:hypothetical protein